MTIEVVILFLRKKKKCENFIINWNHIFSNMMQRKCQSVLMIKCWWHTRHLLFVFPSFRHLFTRLRQKKDQLTSELVFFQRCLPLRASDVAFGSDVHCVSDVTPDGVVGKHHITLRRRSKTSLCRKALHHVGEAVIIGGANIICRRQTSFKKRTFVGRQKCVFCCEETRKRCVGVGKNAKKVRK